MDNSTKITDKDRDDILSGNCKELFIKYANDAGNWSGTPLFNGNVNLLGEKEDRGLLTHIKKAGLVTTFVSDGATWIEFTIKGIDYAHKNGIDLTWINDIKIYKDVDKNGLGYTIYINNECKGSYLSDDPTLVELAGEKWESFIVPGLDNRG